MRHLTARISIWNKLGWMGIIAYCLFSALAPEAMAGGNGWVGFVMALMCAVLIALPLRKPFNAVAMVAVLAWIALTQVVPALALTRHNILWLAIGAAFLVASAWDANPPEENEDDELDADLARAQQLAS